MKDFLEIQFWRQAKWLIIKGYGADCPDYAEGCASCEAKKIVEWIDGHINLLRF